MNSLLLLRNLAQVRRRGLPAKLSSLVLLLHRSPLLKLLPEARILSTSGFSDAINWTIAVIAGLGAFDSVSGATAVVQTSPASGSPTVSATGGASLAFLFQITGAGGHTPNSFQVIGSLPTGLTQTGTRNSKTDSITGIPLQTGSFPITVKAWENAGNSGRSANGSFTITVSAPPAPTISSPPTGGNFTAGDIAKLTVGHTNGFTFTWKRDGTALTVAESILFSRSSPRKYLIPAAAPDPTWRTDAAFGDTSWTSVAGGIGYDTDTAVNFNPFIATPNGNVRTAISGKTSVLLRLPFELANPLALSYLTLKVQCDDGYVAWLNGTEIASQNKPATLTFNSAASANAVDADAIVFRNVPLNQHLALLKAGTNLLAVQALNQSSGSSDLLFNCELAGGINATNSARLVLAGLRPQDAGPYTVTVANPTSSVTSSAANVNLPPSINIHPAPVTIDSGLTTQLSVEAATSPPFTYQWYAGSSGNLTSPVAGATGATFTTAALTATTNYWVRVTNAAGFADSNAAAVTVRILPPSLTVQPASVTIDSGATAQLTAAATGTAPFSWQWYRGNSGDTASPVAGAILPDFTTPVLTQNTSYWARVINSAGGEDSMTAVVSVRIADPYTLWKTAQFPQDVAGDPEITGPAADPDRDGSSNQDEYIFGTAPMTSGVPPVPAITAAAGQPALTFTATRAEGPGYAGRTRLYTIESSANPGDNDWAPVTGFTDIVGDNQSVNYAPAAATGRRFYRLKVRLSP